MEEEKKTNSKKSSEIAFKSVKIGNQEWMSDNLNVDHFRNGDIIPERMGNLLGVIIRTTLRMVKNMESFTIGMQLMTQEAWRPKVGTCHLMGSGQR